MLVFRVGSVQVAKINVSITAVPVMDVRCFTRTFRLMRLSPPGIRAVAQEALAQIVAIRSQLTAFPK